MKRTLLFAVCLFSITALQSQAQDWPAWRGPTGDGQAASTAKPPVTWSESENVKWKVEIPGLGCSTPSVVGNQIILTYASPSGRTEEVEGKDASGARRPTEYQNLFVIAYDIETGNELWKTNVGEGLPHEKGHPTGSYASASTITDGENIYAFFGSLGLYGLDINGNKKWEHKLPTMNTAAGFGQGATPALHENIIVLPWDEEGQSFVAGIDAKTGNEIWKTNRDTNSSWTSPVVVKDGDGHVAVISGTKHTRAYDVKSGQEVWSCGGMSSNPTSSPVANDGVVYIGNSYRGNVLQAISYQGAQGDLTETENLMWSRNKSASYVPTPVVVDGKLYYLKDSVGILVCVDAKTGEEVFKGKRIGLKQIHASPMVADGKIYISSREGDTVVLDPKDDCKVLAKNHLDDVHDASPVAVGSKLILRGRKNLYCIE